MKQIHIVGCSPRSGTTLLHEMMISCFDHDYHCDHEISLFRCNEDVLTQPGVAITKHPHQVVVAKGALKGNPDLHFIYLRRDPRDVIVSKHRNTPGQYFSNLRLWKRFEKIAEKLENHPRFLAITYESLVRSPDQAQKKIAKRFPWLKEKNRFSAFPDYATPSRSSTISLNGLRPVSASSIGRWKEHPQRVANQIKIHGPINNWLINNNYEEDSEWLTSLPIGEHNHDSFFPEKSKLRTIIKNNIRRRKQIFRYRKLVKPYNL